MNREELLHVMDEELRHGKGMEGVLNKVLGEVLGEPSAKEWGSAAYPGHGYSDFMREKDGKCFLDAMTVGKLLEARLAHYSKVKTVEERVTVERSTLVDRSNVYVDGALRIACIDNEDAEIYRLGLIAQLKEGK